MRPALTLAALSCLSVAIGAAPAPVNEPPKLRLSDDAKPVRYALDLRIVPDETGFSGSVEIDIDIVKPVATLWLNATGLKLGKAVAQRGKTISPAKVVAGDADFTGFSFDRPLGRGRIKLRVTYSGDYSLNSVEGLFKQKDGDEAYVFTQFEPIAARRAFPSFDEPNFKVPLQLTLHVKKSHGAFSNTPVLTEADEPDGMKSVRFAPTKPLPTYLIALAVGPFEVVDGGTAGRKKTPLRVLTPKGRAAEAAYAIETTPRIFELLEDYFNIPYPYEKLDQIAIPITVGFGAMENVGLITYGQTLLLAKPASDSLTRQRLFVEVMAHEIAHQWFGNMVTPVWWDDIWLNEAFATWIESKIVDKYRPDWKLKVKDVASKAGAMALDRLVSARKIRQPIESNGDIGNAFDGITYQKGAAVIGMFENYLGEDIFRKGLQSYFAKHQWGNATANDFLAALSRAAGRDIAPAFSTFLDRGGVPLLTVDLQCGKGQPAVAVSQQRFVPAGSSADASTYWQVPVCLKYGSGDTTNRECAVLADPKDQITLRSAKACPEWVLADENADGYYHVRYSGDMLASLLKNAGKLALNERTGLLRNAQALFNGAKMDVKDALSLVPAFSKAPEREIVNATTSMAEGIEKFVPRDLQSNYAHFIQSAFGERARGLGWKSTPNEPEDVRLLRPDVVGLVALRGEDRALIAEARTLAARWLTDRSAIDPQLTKAVLATAAAYGDRDLFEKFVAEIRKTEDRRERNWLVNALGSFRDLGIVNSALQLMLKDGIDIRELDDLLMVPQGNSATRELPWKFVKANFDTLVARMPDQLGSDAGSVLPFAAASLCDSESRRDVAEFFKERIKKFSGGDRNLAQAVESIDLCIARKQAQQSQLAEFLRSY